MNTRACSRQELLRQIAECEFICIDINLYLDAHPEDARALADYNCYAEQLMEMKRTYCMNYGPLHNFGNSLSKDSWKWIDEPWPWQSCPPTCNQPLMPRCNRCRKEV